MTRRIRLILLFTAVAALSLPLLQRAIAQSATQQSPSAEIKPVRDSTVLGVVWTPPEHPGPALRQLDAMTDAGVTALRLTSLPPSQSVLTRADTLGLRLFVDLPISYVSAPALRDSLRSVRPLLSQIQTLANQHPSIQAVGLAHAADTSVPAACPILKKWTEHLHTQQPALNTYYVTPFTAAADECTNAVDYTFIDSRGRTAPVDRWSQWQQPERRVGIGALGTWVHPSTGTGLRMPHSPESQARYLETALHRILDSLETAPPVFVYRWQDESSPPLPFRRYGLHDQTGSPRPSASVLTGFYRGTQGVFAFPSGQAPDNAPIGPILLGWLLVALLGGLTARNAFVRQTVSRFFAAPGFYRTAVKEGREIGVLENALLLSIVTIALGLIGTLTAQIAVERPVTGHIVEALPAALQTPLSLGLTHPTLTGLVVGGATVVLLLGWAAFFTVIARLQGHFTMSQALMLVTWPCWPAIPGLGIALVAATRPPVPTGILGLTLLLGGIVAIIGISVRVLRDFRSVSRLAAPWIFLLALLSPLTLCSLLLVGLVVEYDLPLSLLWHLLTRT